MDQASKCSKKRNAENGVRQYIGDQELSSGEEIVILEEDLEVRSRGNGRLPFDPWTGQTFIDSIANRAHQGSARKKRGDHDSHRDQSKHYALSFNKKHAEYASEGIQAPVPVALCSDVSPPYISRSIMVSGPPEIGANQSASEPIIKSTWPTVP